MEEEDRDGVIHHALGAASEASRGGGFGGGGGFRKSSGESDCDIATEAMKKHFLTSPNRIADSFG